jgi:hypothetical protein
VGVCRRCFDKIEWRKKYRKVSLLNVVDVCVEGLMSTGLDRCHVLRMMMCSFAMKQ